MRSNATSIPFAPSLALLLLMAACSAPTSERAAQPPAAAARPAYGSVMADVARRFELLGRAVSARRFELADYELGELTEQFQDTLVHAAPPKEGHPEVLPALQAQFLQKNVPDLQRALAAHEPSQLTAAFARTATACNGCHQASGHAFIEVPLEPGRSVPSTEPVAP